MSAATEVDSVPPDVLQRVMVALARGWAKGGAFSIEVHRGARHPQVKLVNEETIPPVQLPAAVGE